MIYLPKKVCLIIIHRNPTHILGLSSCHKHQQQRYHNENTKICMFIHYMYVDILFPLTKAIPIKFESVTTNQHTKHGQAIMQRVTISSTDYHTRYHMRYRTFSISLTWIACNETCYHNFNVLPHILPYILSQCSMVWDYLQRVTFTFIQNININFKNIKMMVTGGNTLQIAQNQTNLRENIR